jgi:hypothetical protein
MLVEQIHAATIWPNLLSLASFSGYDKRQGNTGRKTDGARLSQAQHAPANIRGVWVYSREFNLLRTGQPRSGAVKLSEHHFPTSLLALV